MNTIKLYQEKIGKLQKEINGMLDGAVAEVRALTGEENKKVAELKNEIVGLESTLVELREKKDIETVEVADKKVVKDADAEIRSKFIKYVGTGDRFAEEEYRSASATVGTATTSAGLAIPMSIHSEIIKGITEQAPMLQLAKVLYTNGSLRVLKKKKNVEGAKAAFIGENATIAQSTLAFESVELGMHKASCLIAITLEMLNSGVDLEAYIKDEIIEQMAELLNNTFVCSKGASGTPKGLATGTNKTEVELTADGLIDVFNAIHPNYAQNGTWLVSREVFNKISKLKDDAGLYILVRDFVNGSVVYRLLGKEVYVVDGMEGLMFGDIKQALMVAMKDNMQIQKLTETFALNGAIGYLVHQFCDSAVVNDDAFVICTESARARVKK